MLASIHEGSASSIGLMMERGACSEKAVVALALINNCSRILTQYQWTTNDSGRVANDR